MNQSQIKKYIILLIFLMGGWIGPSVMAQHEEEIPDQQPKEKPTSNPSALIDAKKLLLKGDEQNAEGLLRNYIDRYPTDPVAYYELAKILTARKEYPEAKVLAEKAWELDRTNIWYQLFLAETCQFTQDYERALQIFEEIVATNPDNLDYYYQLAALYMGLGKYTEAIRTYDKIETRLGITEEISLQKHKIYLHLKDYKEAEAELQKLIQVYPDDSRYYGILAEYYMSREKKEKALELYNRILEIDPGNAYIHMTLADYYRKTGEKEKVFEELKLGFSNPNLDVDTKINILLSFYTINEIVSDLKEEAFTLARLLIQTHPDDPKVYSIYGDLLSQNQQYREARDAFLRVIAIDSSRYVVWEELLRMDLLMSDYQHLQAYGHRAVELYPEQPVICLLTALAELQLKNFTEAEKLLDRGVKMVVGNNELLAQYYMYLGDTYHALNRAAESDKAYEKSLQIRDNNPYVLNNYSYYLALRGQELEKAAEMSKRALNLEPNNSSFQDTYGWVMFKLGRYEEALEWIGKSLEDRESASGEVLEHYGDVLIKLGRTEEALDYWKRALEKEGGSKLLNDKITQRKWIEE
ncbi:MAG: hypothetical protein D4R67_11370 [Bacteroidetes bacterium]|nr:MAG: hypothetical protein D4R67_11370 [Bacteroidota bacterium]